MFVQYRGPAHHRDKLTFYLWKYQKKNLIFLADILLSQKTIFSYTMNICFRCFCLMCLIVFIWYRSFKVYKKNIHKTTSHMACRTVHTYSYIHIASERQTRLVNRYMQCIPLSVCLCFRAHFALLCLTENYGNAGSP